MRSLPILVFVYLGLAAIETLFLSGIGGFKQWWEVLPVALFALPALSFGLDICRILCRKFVDNSNQLSEVRGQMIFIVCVIVMPLPMTLVLGAADLIAPGHVGSVVDFFPSAWKVAGSMMFVHGFLRLRGIPVSCRGIYMRFKQAIDSGRLEREHTRALNAVQNEPNIHADAPNRDDAGASNNGADQAVDRRADTEANSRGLRW